MLGEDADAGSNPGFSAGIVRDVARDRARTARRRGAKVEPSDTVHAD